MSSVLQGLLQMAMIAVVASIGLEYRLRDGRNYNGIF